MRLQPGGRAGQDDRPAAGRPQVRDGRLGGVPHAGEVDVDHVLPGRVVEFFQRAEAEDPGVGRHDVQPPELGHAVVDGRLEGAVVTDVGLGGDDAPVQRLDLLHRLGQIVGGGHRIRHRSYLAAQVDGDDVRALLGQPDRVRPALAPSRARDEGDFALELARHLPRPFQLCHFWNSFHIISHTERSWARPFGKPATLRQAPAARPGRQVRDLKPASGFSSQARSGGRAGSRPPPGGRAPIETGTGPEPIETGTGRDRPAPPQIARIVWTGASGRLTGAARPRRTSP